MTVIDEISSTPVSSNTSIKAPQNEFNLLSGNDLETIVLRIVKDDPFNTISEIKQQLQNHQLYEDIGWWKIFFFLKKRGLISMRARFRYARGRH